ncbi:OprD family porin [Pseudomonas capeferrum]|uniref:OprD family porin n=1 Tax=Pseudomonas capeferrum TaxID=1495066 RepID=UPI0015E3E77D|nr:OprD family porin [Pseudomonas capeferrum]MBA1200309.1 OprD family porin [Pseudomonas capeferrum]
MFAVLPLFTSRRTVGLYLLSASSLTQAAGFMEDSHARLEARTVYFNRDFRDGQASSRQGASKREEWAQGLIVDIQSGYTPGIIGLGVDVIGMAGFKLDSSADDSNSGLLPSSGNNPRGSADRYGKLGITGKVRISETLLKYGSMMPDEPLLKYNDGRLLPTLFHGALLTSEQVNDLKFTLARLTQYTARDSTDRQDIRVHCKNKRYACDIDADHFDLAGVAYRFNEHVSGQYQVARLDDVYRQQFLGLAARQPLRHGSLIADLRAIRSDDIGNARAGDIDHRALSGMLGYNLSGHTLSVGWQRMYGQNAMPYLDGSNPYLVNYLQVNDFAAAQERSWQVRYDYDFKALGVPGLSFLARYVNGDHIRVPGSAAEGKEWERDTELKYQVQTGTFKDVSLRLRNATFRSNYQRWARDVDETRLIVSYTFDAW